MPSSSTPPAALPLPDSVVPEEATGLNAGTEVTVTLYA
jgi:hypothetical protein